MSNDNESEPLESSSTLPNFAANFTRVSTVTVAVDPVALVVTECITVTSAMRKHGRWAHSSVSAILGGSSTKTAPTARKVGKPGNAAMLDEDDAVSSRWGLRGKKGKSLQDNPLMAAFSRLRAELKKCKDIKTYDTPSLLHPFLQVIRSSSTSAPITSLALIAITKFLSYNIISRESPRLSEAMQLLSAAITNCRFEASDPATDEIVLLRILKLMEGIISAPGGDLLGDESVCGMMETGLSMCCQPRLSDLLRRSAEISMVSMCQVIFERLKHLEVEAGDEPGALEEDTKDDMEIFKMDPGKKEAAMGTGAERSEGIETRSSASLEKPDGASDLTLQNGSSTIDLPSTNNKLSGEDTSPIKPYSLPSIRELLRVLVDLLDPHDKQHTDTMRIMALRIVDVAFEVAGPSIANHPSLATLAKDTLCRYLFQLVRSENMAILNEALRVCGTLLATCRGVLRLQQELFLSYVVACLFPRVDIPLEPGIEPWLYEGVPQAPSLVKQSQPRSDPPSSGRSTPVPIKDRQRLGLEGGSRKPDAREAMVENVGALVRTPSFMVELFVNYDCEIDRSDLCMDMVGLLSRNAFPDSATWSTTNVPPLCLDSLLAYVQFVKDRLDDEPVREGLPDPGILRQQRARKKTIIRGATKFNEKPKSGISYLASQGIIENPDDPRNIAKFVQGTSRIDKKILGEFLSKKENGEILKEFMDLFDFAGLRIDEAIRLLLGSFRLPGESALIERIVEVFTELYMEKAKPEHIEDATAAYILTYAIIMLNTDQHNPNFKGQKRMAIEDFARNLKGCNDSKDFSRDFLQEIYDSIRTHEIVLPEEHDNKNSYDHAWKELLVKVESTPDLVVCDTNIFDADMFAATWRPIVATLSYVFMSATDDAVFARVVVGFDQCAQIAAKYGLTDALDRIIDCLAHISTLAPERTPSTSLNTEVQHEQRSVMVSETAVRFGRDDRAQLATIVLFGVIKNNENSIRDGWNSVLKILLNLFVNSLIPSSFSSARESLELPAIPLQSPAQIIDKGDRAAETGLFSAFTSYVSSFANDEPPEPSDQEIEYTLCTIDTIQTCSLDVITTNILDASMDALNSLFVTLLSHIPEESSPRVIMVKPDVPPTSPNKANGSRRSISKAAYDPSFVFVLELATLLALRDEKTVEAFGKDVATALETVIHDSGNVHPVVTSRVVYYLLQLLRASNDHDFIKTPIVLHALSSFDGDLLKQCAEPLLKGLLACISGPQGLRNEMAGSPDFWSILHSLRTIPEAAPGVFKVVEDLAGSVQTGISADNYEATVVLLNEFATAASVGAIYEQRTQGRRTKTGQQAQALSKKQEPDAVVQRGVKAMVIVYQLTSRVPQLIEKSQLEPNEAWNAYWSPIFRALTTQCLNPCREIRAQAFSTLQRTLLNNGIVSPDHTEWTKIFGQVLFPLITQLLKPEVYQSDPVGMSETRVRASTLLCKIYLHYLVALSEWDGMLDLWLKIIAIMDRLTNSGQGDNLEEAVSENLKNILLVMSNGGFLAPPDQNPDQAELWSETWKRLDRFLPHFFEELFPEEAKKAKEPIAQPPSQPSEEQKEDAVQGDEKQDAEKA
ncbi:Sec7-domain-containing protein [Pseudovirgaria hyperparasitica]|uniref:Sec7-domain-containing protein n=1 Tax=Pseudovirgaria hyperparasitica TaxID=470096 RepID=A0A6A6VZ51_9PEZI|nr:Sec7-domain-containing protein [Pseudovirgaria hyperparasitica]KAF2754597.1 Sec7-domain-containing protein [Pseudovirgaria hyperparasitica]